MVHVARVRSCTLLPSPLPLRQFVPGAEWNRFHVTFQTCVAKKEFGHRPAVASGVAGAPGSNETVKRSETLPVSKIKALMVTRRAIRLACRWVPDLPCERSHALSSQRYYSWLPIYPATAGMSSQKSSDRWTLLDIFECYQEAHPRLCVRGNEKSRRGYRTAHAVIARSLCSATTGTRRNNHSCL